MCAADAKAHLDKLLEVRDRRKITEPDLSKHLLAYQQRWLKDESRFKIIEKSRRIGATFVQAYEAVRMCAAGEVRAWWFSSADESAAREFILYCEQWAKFLHAGATAMGESLIDDERGLKSFSLTFGNGGRINALRSNPKSFRSKGGGVILDEFAFHEDPEGMWKAARPTITWGDPLRILSTYNGKSGLYYRMIEDVRSGKLPWSLHTVDIYLAVAEGLADKILGRKLTWNERAGWLAEEEANCGDADTWAQEYCCIPIDESTAFLTYEQIAACERPGLADEPLTATGGDLFVGVDVGRKRDLTVAWVLERSGPYWITRLVRVMERAPFAHQLDALSELLAAPRVRRACVDATGLGMQLAEDLQRRFGSYRVEGVTFTGQVKSDLAHRLRQAFEDKALAIPADPAIREDLHSVRKTTTAAGNVRFDAERSDAGHADRFWALALAHHAGDSSGPLFARSGGRRSSHDDLRGF